MSERITRDEVAATARLARLRLDESELDAVTRRIDGILAHLDDFDALDLTDVAPTDRPHELRNVWRTDEIGPTLSNEEALAGAPATENGQFSVPTILGEAP